MWIWSLSVESVWEHRMSPVRILQQIPTSTLPYQTACCIPLPTHQFITQIFECSFKTCPPIKQQYQLGRQRQHEIDDG